MRKKKAVVPGFAGAGVLLAAGLIVAIRSAHAGNSIGSAAAPRPVPPVANPCPRPPAGSVVESPPALFSHNGVLAVDFSYQSTIDGDSRTLFCFMTPNGLENPTLHVRPGDHLIVNVTNNTPASPVHIRVEPSSTAAVIERLRIALGSIRWFGEAQATTASAWCVRGRIVTRAVERSSREPLPSSASPAVEKRRDA